MVLKRRLYKLAGFSETFDKLDPRLRMLGDLSNDVSKLDEVAAHALVLLKSLGTKIRNRKEEDFDIFTTHRKEVAIDKRLCFVMMPFNPPRIFDPVYSAIQKAVRGAGLKYVRSDNVFDTRAIIIDIWEKTRKAIACIADTSPPNNPNVFDMDSNLKRLESFDKPPWKKRLFTTSATSTAVLMALPRAFRVSFLARANPPDHLTVNTEMHKLILPSDFRPRIAS